jgi:hypothetical protein
LRCSSITADVVAHFVEGLGQRAAVIGDLGDVIAMGGGEDGAQLADLHGEGDEFKFFGEVAALEEAEVDLFLALVGMDEREGVEVFTGEEPAADVAELLVDGLAGFAAAGVFGDVRSAHFLGRHEGGLVLVVELTQMVAANWNSPCSCLIRSTAASISDSGGIATRRVASSASSMRAIMFCLA